MTFAECCAILGVIGDRAQIHRVGEECEADALEAIYWFAAESYSGQGDPLYKIVCSGPFQPGPISSEPDPDSMAGNILENLRAERDRPD